MNNRFLSRFTPSLMGPEALEAIFVQRHTLADEILEKLRECQRSGRSEHTLFEGPRGVGKTHLISLVYYRLQKSAEGEQHPAVAWLREEEWGVTSFRDFLIRILRALAGQDDGDETLSRSIESLYGQNPLVAEAKAAEMLDAVGRQRAVFVLVENLDELLQQMGKDGGGKLSAFLRSHRYCSVLGTVQSAYEGFLRPHAPLSSVFNVRRLEPLSFDEGIALLSKIASFDGDEALSTFLATPRGRARVRALEFLAGGNHRAYVVFSRFLTRDSLEDIVEPLLRVIDDLTPYYQSRMAWLPPEQRKIVELLCEHRRPTNRWEIARRCFMGEQAVTTHLERLAHIGHVHSVSISGEPHYELSEPLMRLSVEVKRHRGTPVRLLMDFLRLWYSSTELKKRIALLPSGNEIERRYALPLMESTLGGADEDPRVRACSRDFDAAVRSGSHEQALKAVEELAAIRGSPGDYEAMALCLLQLGRKEEAAAACDRIPEAAPQDPQAWLAHARVLSRLDRHRDSAGSCERAIELDSKFAQAWDLRAGALLQLGLAREALAASDEAVRLRPDDPLLWLRHGSALAELECFKEAARSFARMAELAPEDPVAHVYGAAAHVELKQYDQALESATLATSLDGSCSDAWLVRGLSLAGLNRHGEALESLDTVIRLGDESALLHHTKAELLLHAGRWREAARSLDIALGLAGGSDPGATRGAAPLLRAFVRRCGAPVTLELGIRLLVLIHRKHNALNSLAQGLVACIPDVLSDEMSHGSAALWLDTWRGEAGDYSEFRMPLRLLCAATSYNETRDARVLLELPLEERRLLAPLLDIEIQATA